MIRSKALSSSQGDLVDSVDSTEYRVASNIYSVHELSSTGNKLPLVIRIEDGFYGKTDWTTVSSDEVINSCRPKFMTDQTDHTSPMST